MCCRQLDSLKNNKVWRNSSHEHFYVIVWLKYGFHQCSLSLGKNQIFAGTQKQIPKHHLFCRKLDKFWPHIFSQHFLNHLSNCTAYNSKSIGSHLHWALILKVVKHYNNAFFQTYYIFSTLEDLSFAYGLFRSTRFRKSAFNIHNCVLHSSWVNLSLMQFCHHRSVPPSSTHTIFFLLRNLMEILKIVKLLGGCKTEKWCKITS